MQQEVLEANKGTDLEVYAVWFAMYPGDVQDRWIADALTDPRVTHYWDEGKSVGRWFGDRVDAMRPQLAPGSKGVEFPVLWDAYLVYGPEARWTDEPTELRRWGRTVLGTQQYLREAVEALTQGSQ